jgi:hypothetical protein
MQSTESQPFQRKREAICSSETLADFQQALECYIPHSVWKLASGNLIWSLVAQRKWHTTPKLKMRLMS